MTVQDHLCFDDDCKLHDPTGHVAGPTAEDVDFTVAYESSEPELMEHGPWFHKRDALSIALSNFVNVGTRNPWGVLVTVDEDRYYADVELELPPFVSGDAATRWEALRHQRFEYTDHDRAHEECHPSPQYRFHRASRFVHEVVRAKDAANMAAVKASLEYVSESVKGNAAATDACNLLRISLESL